MSQKNNKLQTIYNKTVGKKIGNFDSRYEAYKKYNLESFTKKYEGEMDEVLDALDISFTDEKKKELMTHIFNSYQKLVLVNPDYKIEKSYLKDMCVNFYMINTPNPMNKIITNIGIGLAVLYLLFKISGFLAGDSLIISDINALMLYLSAAIVVFGTYKNTKDLFPEYQRYQMKMNLLKWTNV